LTLDFNRAIIVEAVTPRRERIGPVLGRFCCDFDVQVL
jgi:hypothetical protein